jgi:hypothetical protein
MTCPRGQNHAIAWGKIDGALRFGLIREHETDGADYTIQNFFITMAVDGIGIAGSI